MMMKLRRLWIQLTADRRRFGMLCGALLVGMLLWSRLIVVSRMPRMAIATDENSLASAKDVHDNQPATQSNTPIVVALASAPAHDPFVISPQHFPKPSAPANSEKQTEKSDSEAAEETYQIESRLTATLNAIVGRLRLDAVMSGSVAVISGKTYRTGEFVLASEDSRSKTPDPSRTFRFRLEEVKQRSVVLECEGRRFELEMVTPRQ